MTAITNDSETEQQAVITSPLPVMTMRQPVITANMKDTNVVIRCTSNNVATTFQSLIEKGVKMRVRKLQMGQQDGFGSFCIRSKGSTSLVWSQLLVLRAVWALLWAVRSSKSLFHRQMCKCCCWSSSTWTIMYKMIWTMRWRSTKARIQRNVWWKPFADRQKLNVLNQYLE